MDIQISCIGSGNMGGALMKAASRVLGAGGIALTDADQGRAASAAAEIGAVHLRTNREAALEGRFVVLAVKPQVAPAVLKEIAPQLRERSAQGNPAVLVSIVAGLSISAMRTWLAQGAGLSGGGADTAPASGGPGADAVSADDGAVPASGGTVQSIIRLMPNTPALVARGMIALSSSAETKEADVEALERILSQSGLIDRVEEKYMDAVTALSGSGPAFAYLFIEALADGGVRAGLPRDKALRYAARTVLGAAAMVEETGQHPGVLKDAVCSPGGTTIAGVSALEDRAFRGAVMAAVDAAYRRAKELS
jgi:pyrroline-5-carboxylate reductase